MSEQQIILDYAIDSLLNIEKKYGNIEVNKDGEQNPVYLLELIEDLKLINPEKR